MTAEFRHFFKRMLMRTAPARQMLPTV
jgi:hypothetical protein